MPSTVSHAVSGELVEEAPMLMLALVLDSGGREITIVMSATPAGQAGVIVEYDALKNVTNNRATRWNIWA